MQARSTYCDKIFKSGEELVANRHPSSRDIQQRIKSLRDMWQRLNDLSEQRKLRLNDALESHQVIYIYRIIIILNAYSYYIKK
jgi:hypothetical protein